jgi:hypothetical protein
MLSQKSRFRICFRQCVCLRLQRASAIVVFLYGRRQEGHERGHAVRHAIVHEAVRHKAGMPEPLSGQDLRLHES